jgi:hypothetical protein
VCAISISYVDVVVLLTSAPAFAPLLSRDPRTLITSFVPARIYLPPFEFFGAFGFAESNATIAFRRDPKRVMEDLSASNRLQAPVSATAPSWLGESGCAHANYRAFLKHARKPSSHDQQSLQHGV